MYKQEMLQNKSNTVTIKTIAAIDASVYNSPIVCVTCAETVVLSLDADPHPDWVKSDAVILLPKAVIVLWSIQTELGQVSVWFAKNL